ncbi:MAG TPA: VCBS repeat-containing protein [Phycisphaerales bacterium]|nr:VCBS repeat-containing protein [Phycisphaerales bacterium]
MPNATTRALLSILFLSGAANVASAQSDTSLGRYFGFDEPRYLVIGDNAGPVASADFDGDGKTDIAIVNNGKSRIEIHTQREKARSEEEQARIYKVNELPPSRWYDRVEVSIPHRISGFRTADVDGDGMLDIVYAGTPSELVVLRQKSRLTFEIGPKLRVDKLSAGQDGIEIADVMGDVSPELLVTAEGKIKIYSLTKHGPDGTPLELGSSGDIVAFFVEDFNGDGLKDILGVIPDDDSPLRLWFQQSSTGSAGKDGLLGPETRFESPALREAEPIRFPGRPAASLGLIEKASRRILVDDLLSENIAPLGKGGENGAGERDAIAEIFGFPGGSDKERAFTVADIDADGRDDFLVTDKKTNSIYLYQQTAAGLGKPRTCGTFKNPKAIAAGQWDQGNQLEVFVLSEDEKAVGVSRYDSAAKKLSFPEPLPVATAGASPVAMGYAKLKDGPALAVVVKDKRDHTLELHRPGGTTPVTLKLEGVNRPPQSSLAGDFDHDGSTDLALFTPGEPMVMVKGLDGEPGQMKVLTDKTMPQFGLVQAAGPNNTAMLDVNGDSFPELLIADQNFVRACDFSAEKGWRVVEQITMPDRNAALVGLAVLPTEGGDRIVASDKDGKRLIVMARDKSSWTITDKLRLSGFDLGAIRAGAFSGDNQPNVLCFGDAAFAVVKQGGTRVSLEEVASYRSDEDDRLEHEMEVGDLNGDGFVDLVVLDARDQMCQIFTLSQARKLYLATEFKVFESRLFSRGETREFQPSAAVIADFTGDGANDLLLLAHDRLIVYPQMMKK